jgi:hypothetical protein
MAILDQRMTILDLAIPPARAHRSRAGGRKN